MPYADPFLCVFPRVNCLLCDCTLARLTIARTRAHARSTHVLQCFTLGYFTLSIPWSIQLRYRERRRDVVPAGMFVHHLLVVFGALVYVLGGVCAFYGAVAFACMELTNLFFIPRVLFEVIGRPVDGALCTINGILLVLTFVIFRVGVCTVVGVLFTMDLVAFESSHTAEQVFVWIAYAVFMGVLVLSWVWLHRVLSELRAGVKMLLRQRRARRDQQAKLAQLHKSPFASPPQDSSLPQASLPMAGTGFCASRGDDQDSAGVTAPAAAAEPTAEVVESAYRTDHTCGGYSLRAPSKSALSGGAITAEQLDPIVVAPAAAPTPHRSRKVHPAPDSTDS